METSGTTSLSRDQCKLYPQLFSCIATTEKPGGKASLIHYKIFSVYLEMLGTCLVASIPGVSC